MKKFTGKLGVILMSASLIFAQNAFAARMGKSRSTGMQRSVSTQQSTNTTANRVSQQPAAVQPQQQRSGMSSLLTGLGLGALGGYLMGKSMNSNHESATQQSAATNESGIPWGIIGILGLLLVIGLMIFRRKTATQGANNNALGGLQQPGNNSFDIPNIRRDNMAASSSMNNAAGAAPVTVNPLQEKMVDGIEVQYFLRQAKGMFLHIQSMNTPENVSEVAKYMTPELYTELQQLIASNDYVADFSQLDCQLLQSTAENGNFIASVKFFGKVSESPDTPVVDFAEIWNFIKPATVANAKWLVAGIQQVNSSN